MPLYGDFESRGPRLGRGDVLPSYSPRLGPETLEAGPRVDYGDLALEAAQAGSWGGAIGGPPLRAVRGGSELWSDPLAADRGRLGAAFASDNPYVAATYAGPKGKVYPFRISPDELVEARHGGWVEGMVRPTACGRTRAPSGSPRLRGLCRPLITRTSNSRPRPLPATQETSPAGRRAE